jgi:hypothetical protein
MSRRPTQPWRALQDNLEVRFYGLLIFMTASQVAGDFERGERNLLAMHVIADQAEIASKAAEPRDIRRVIRDSTGASTQ